MRLLCALCLLFLACHTAASQPTAPLRPLIVQLDSGTVLQRYYVGLDSAEYNRRLVEVRVARQRLQVLEAGRQLDAAQIANLRADLLACRKTGVGLAGNYTALRGVTDAAWAAPVRPPLLLDKRVYGGVGAGAVLGVLAVAAIKIFFTHK